MAICSGGFLFRDGSVLLGHRAEDRRFYPGVWDAIGGHVEPPESPEEALVRELQEEIAIKPKAWTRLAVIPDPYPERHGEMVYHIFVITDWEGAGPALKSSEHSEIRWFPVVDAIALELAHPFYVEILRTLMAHHL